MEIYTFSPKRILKTGPKYSLCVAQWLTDDRMSGPLLRRTMVAFLFNEIIALLPLFRLQKVSKFHIVRHFVEDCLWAYSKSGREMHSNRWNFLRWHKFSWMGEGIRVCYRWCPLMFQDEFLRIFSHAARRSALSLPQLKVSKRFQEWRKSNSIELSQKQFFSTHQAQHSFYIPFDQAWSVVKPSAPWWKEEQTDLVWKRQLNNWRQSTAIVLYVPSTLRNSVCSIQ